MSAGTSISIEEYLRTSFEGYDREYRDGGEEVPSKPPFIAIEILSLDDRHSDVQRKLDDYRQWGVPNIWLIDPQLRKLYVYNGDLRGVDAFEIADPPIRFTHTDVFQ